MAKPLTCKYCGQKFHKGKTNAFGRMSRHIWKNHAEEQRKNIKKGQRKKKKQLTSEMEYTDDMIIQALLDAGINITPVRQQQYAQPYQPQYAPIPYAQNQTEHESLTGAVLSAFKLGMTVYKTVKVAKKIKSVVKKK